MFALTREQPCIGAGRAQFQHSSALSTRSCKRCIETPFRQVSFPSCQKYLAAQPLVFGKSKSLFRTVGDNQRLIHFTLGFSARQNHLVACVARPSWVNVFLGRLNAYAADEKLCDGRWVGERATLASQATVAKLRQDLGISTRQIAASLRNGEQVSTLAGVDVFTMPTPVAEGW